MFDTEDICLLIKSLAILDQFDQAILEVLIEQLLKVSK